MTTLVFPCTHFVEDPDPRRRLDADWCANCGFHRNVHGPGPFPAGLLVNPILTDDGWENRSTGALP